MSGSQTVYKAKVACSVCPKLSQRKLDYWVDTGVIHPTEFIRTAEKGRSIFLFTFSDLVTIRLVCELRNQGITLDRIRRALQAMREDGEDLDAANWLLTDGKNLYRLTDNPQVIQSLSKGENGQFAFAMVALREMRARLKIDLEQKGDPHRRGSYLGDELPWSAYRAG